MKVVFAKSETTPQLHLADRKLISARFARLKSIVAARAEDPEDAPAPVRKFARDTEATILDVLDNHRERPDEPPLDETLQTIDRAVQNRSNGEDSADVAEGSAAFSAEAGLVSCKQCSIHKDRVCRGLFSDWKLFVDGADRRGGLCVNFVRELTEHMVAFAEDWFKQQTGVTLRAAPPEISIRLASLGAGHDGTMPLDGSYNPDTGELVLEWPTDPDAPDIVDEAILMLPYLIFHELFVHGGQGRALDRTIGPIPYDCAFTEGAVDAAARDLLITTVLPDIQCAPFRALRAKAQERCILYGEARSQPSNGSLAASENRKMNARVRRARSQGLRKVWIKFDGLSMQGQRAPVWKYRILTTLNLLMTPEQRDDFMMAAEFWDDLSPGNRDDLIGMFDKFLEDRDVDNLLARLHQLASP